MTFAKAACLAACLAITGMACTTADGGGECRNARTGEALTQVRDADGRLWEVEELSYTPYPSADPVDGCSIPWEARVDTDGSTFIGEYIDETGKVVYTETRLAEWVFHPGSGERIGTAPDPSRVLRLHEYRWR